MRGPADRALSYDIANIPVLFQATVALELFPVLCIYVSICFLATSYICVTLGKVLLDKWDNSKISLNSKLPALQLHINGR
jgi:hypothetical protein